MTIAPKKYRKAARRAYRFLIVLCCLALVAAVLIWYAAREGG